MSIVETQLNQIEPTWTKQKWLLWLDEESTVENVRKRFGNDNEALIYWPNDYYTKLEKWWHLESNRFCNPIETIIDNNGIIRIEDGWHRIAISHKLNLDFVPVMIHKSQ